jgi:pimeloyl-ACP methyl ester carboxylesterase
VALELTRREPTSFGEVAFDAFGSGPPVVLVHGTPSRARVWRRVVPELAAGHRVIVFDLLGYGDSVPSAGQEVGVAVGGRELAELLARWKLDAPALVGHDIGAAAVLRAHLVEHAPAAAIALIDAVVLRPWITPPSRQMQGELERYRALPDRELAETIRRHLATATAAPLEPGDFAALFGQWEGADGQARYLRNLAGFDEADTDALEPLLPSLTAPLLVLWGEQDAWLPVETSARIAALVPGAERVVVPDAGHFSMEDRPQAIARELRRFLAGARAG